MFLLVISGVVSGSLLSSGYFVASFAFVVLTVLGFYFLERREKKSEAILRDKPIY
jgi:ABC-type Mn2+/Zn2+ transport system permease subunit